MDMTDQPKDPVWAEIRHSTREAVESEPVLASFLHATILKHDTLEQALSFLLAQKIDSPSMPALLMREVIEEAFYSDATIGGAIRKDLIAVHERDSACDDCATAFIFFKGFHALESFRVAHFLWQKDRRELALFLQNRISVEFGVDIHPAAKLGHGIMLDHATGVVIGETSVIGNNVSLMQSVTLGGTGKESGDRHPKIGSGVLISAGAKVLGNIRVGEGSLIGPGSVVLKDIPSHSLATGVPASVIGTVTVPQPALTMDHSLCSFDNSG